MGRKVTQDEVEEWVTLHNKGYTYKDIGKKYGRHPKTVGESIRKHRMKGGRGGEKREGVDLVLGELVKAHFILLANLYAFPWIIELKDEKILYKNKFGEREWQDWIDGSARNLVKRIAQIDPEVAQRLIKENQFINQHHLTRVLNFKMPKQKLEPAEIKRRAAWVKLLKEYCPEKLASLIE